jgi:hypothetical protein
VTLHWYRRSAGSPATWHRRLGRPDHLVGRLEGRGAVAALQNQRGDAQFAEALCVECIGNICFEALIAASCV